MTLQRRVFGPCRGPSLTQIPRMELLLLRAAVYLSTSSSLSLSLSLCFIYLLLLVLIARVLGWGTSNEKWDLKF